MHACTQSVVKEQTRHISLTEFGRVKNIGVELLVRMKLKITYWKKNLFFKNLEFCIEERVIQWEL